MSTYLIFPSIAAAQAASNSQASALGCDGITTKYWWAVQPLTDGTCALVINPGTQFDTDVTVGKLTAGLTAGQKSAIINAVTAGTKLPWVLPLSTFTSRMNAQQQQAVVNSTNPDVSKGWSLIQSTGASNATRKVDLSDPIIQAMLDGMLTDGIINQTQYAVVSAYVAVAQVPN